MARELEEATMRLASSVMVGEMSKDVMEDVAVMLDVLNKITDRIMEEQLGPGRWKTRLSRDIADILIGEK